MKEGFMEMLTTLNFLFFLLSVILLYFAKKNRRAKQSDKLSDALRDNIFKIHQMVIARVSRVRGLHVSAVHKIEDATENAILQFSSLVDRVNTTTGKTNEILEEMKEKISLNLVRDTVGKREVQDPKAIREKYERILKEMTDQFSLVIDQKTQDMDHLDTVRKRINQVADNVQVLAVQEDTAQKIEVELREISSYIDTSIISLKEAIDIESRFIHSTVLLLQDIVLSLVESFIQISTIMDSTLGKSSSFGEEIEAIIVNLQFEDVSKEMSRYVVEILSSIIKDLNQLDIDTLIQDDSIQIDFKEKSNAFEALDPDTEEDVTFF